MTYRPPAPDPRPTGVTLTNWDLGGGPSSWAYLNAGELFPTVEIGGAHPVAVLPEDEQPEIAGLAVEPGLTLDEYVTSGPVDGIVVVKEGCIAYERYPRMRPDQRHLLMSVSKAFVSAVVGILEQRGALYLGRPVDAVIDDLRHSGWAGASAGSVLAMASGIDCPEVGSPGSYDDPAHPFYRFEASLGWRPSDGGSGAPDSGLRPSTYEFVSRLRAARPPDQVYEYTSVNTFVLSWLVERVAGTGFHDVLARELWDHVGFEAPAQLCVSPAGAPVSHGGLSMTVRDVARFGMLFTPSAGVISDAPIIGGDHLRRIQEGGRHELHPDGARAPAHLTAAYGSPLPPASRQWDHVIEDGDLFKGGFGGQGLYVSPARDLVVAFTGTPQEDGSVNLLRSYCRRLARALG